MKLRKINQPLGELESKIMEVIWQLKKASVREVLSKMEKGTAYTTVMTVMGRLAQKGILKRKLDDSGSYIYTPTKDKQSFFKLASQHAINGLIDDFGEVAVAQFFNTIESSNLKELAKWRKKLKKIK